MSITIKYDTFATDFDALPETSRLALVSRGLTHYMSNEVSARVGASFKADAVKAAKDAKGTDLDKSEREAAESGAIPSSDSEIYLARREAIRKEFWESLLSGSIGIRERGPTRDPLEVEMDSIVTREMVASLKDKGLHKGAKYPTNDTEYVLKGTPVTFAQLKAAYRAKHEARVKRDAEKVLADREKGAKRAAGESLEDLIG